MTLYESAIFNARRVIEELLASGEIDTDEDKQMLCKVVENTIRSVYNTVMIDLDEVFRDYNLVV